MTTSAAGASRTGIYFFLSYAHSIVTADRIGSDTDPSVGRFVADLRAAVAEQASPANGMRIAFFDQDIPAASDLKSQLSDALGRAEVFVPLYSPTYFTMSWPMREQAVYRARLLNSPGGSRPDEHVMPVLWTPFPIWRDTPDEVGKALQLAPDLPEYAENGMRVLVALNGYRRAYDTIVQRLATKIVSIAEHSPLRPSAAPDLDTVPDAAPLEGTFVVSLMSPGQPGPLATLDVGLDSQPFDDDREPAVARYVANRAERLGFRARIQILAEVVARADTPAIVIVDPMVTADPGGFERLRDTFTQLPPWVLPLVVTDIGDSPVNAVKHADWTAATIDAIAAAGRPPAARADTVADLADRVPRLVARARQLYLRYPRDPDPPRVGPVSPPDVRVRPAKGGER